MSHHFFALSTNRVCTRSRPRRLLLDSEIITCYATHTASHRAVRFARWSHQRAQAARSAKTLLHPSRLSLGRPRQVPSGGNQLGRSSASHPRERHYGGSRAVTPSTALQEALWRRATKAPRGPQGDTHQSPGPKDCKASTRSTPTGPAHKDCCNLAK